MKVTLNDVERLDHAEDEVTIIEGYFSEMNYFDEEDYIFLQHLNDYEDVYDYLVMNEETLIALDADGGIVFVMSLRDWYRQIMKMLDEDRKERN